MDTEGILLPSSPLLKIESNTSILKYSLSKTFEPNIPKTLFGSLEGKGGMILK